MSISKRFHYPGYTGETNFQVRHGESLKKFIIVDGGIRTHDPKTHGSADDAICEGISGVLVHLTTCTRLTDSLHKLSRITAVLARRIETAAQINTKYYSKYGFV